MVVKIEIELIDEEDVETLFELIDDVIAIMDMSGFIGKRRRYQE